MLKTEISVEIPWLTMFKFNKLAPKNSAIAWWPRQTPNKGLLIEASIILNKFLCSLGSPGPGDNIILSNSSNPER